MGEAFLIGFRLCYSSLPWPTLLDLDFEWDREDGADEDDESEGYRVLESELIGYSLDDIDGDEYLESEEDRTTYLFTDVRIDMFACIMSIRSDGTVESHDNTTEYDTYSEYLDSVFHDDEHSCIVHKKSCYQSYDSRIW